MSSLAKLGALHHVQTYGTSMWEGLFKGDGSWTPERRPRSERINGAMDTAVRNEYLKEYHGQDGLKNPKWKKNVRTNVKKIMKDITDKEIQEYFARVYPTEGKKSTRRGGKSNVYKRRRRYYTKNNNKNKR
jgi:hypothetical protein